MASPQAELTPEQEELLVQVVEAARGLSRDERQKFITLQTGQGKFFIYHRGFPHGHIEAYAGDVEWLGRENLLAITYTSGGIGSFDVSPHGLRYYDQTQRRADESTTAQVAERPATLASGSDRFTFDIAISFAGPQRPLAEQLAHIVREAGYNVFYDDFYQEGLWGKELPVFFDEVYRKKSRFCVMFISEEYASRMWTNHERRSAQARALEQRGQDYILPIKVDDTELPGMPPTIGYVSLERHTIKDIGHLLIRRLQQSHHSSASSEQSPEPAQSSAAKVRDKHLPRFRRAEAEWSAERDTRPLKLDDPKFLLGRVSTSLLDFRSELDDKVGRNLLVTLDQLIREAKTLQQHRVYLDGGKSYNEFWQRGDAVFQRLAEVMNDIG